jgi:hypothetical protein
LADAWRFDFLCLQATASKMAHAAVSGRPDPGCWHIIAILETWLLWMRLDMNPFLPSRAMRGNLPAREVRFLNRNDRHPGEAPVRRRLLEPIGALPEPGRRSDACGPSASGVAVLAASSHA